MVRGVQSNETVVGRGVSGKDTQRGFRLRVSAPVPAELVTVVGDAIHNMRSALDAVAYELAVRHVGFELDPEQEKATEFPITKGPEEFEAFFWERKRRPELYGDHERAALRCVQPFAINEGRPGPRRRYASLGRAHLHPERAGSAHYLSIVDKHRRLPCSRGSPTSCTGPSHGCLPPPTGWASYRM